MAATLAAATGVANDGDITATRPTGTADGDLLVAVIFSDSGAATTDITAPAGWAVSGSPGTGPGGAKGWVYTKTASSEPATWSWNLNNATANAVHTLRITGASGVEVVPSWGGSGSSSTSHVAPSISPASTDALLVCAAYAIVASAGVATFTPPGGMTEATDLAPSDFSPGWAYSTTAHQQLAASGATGTKTFTSSISSDGAAGGSITVSLAIASAVVEAPLSWLLEVEFVPGSGVWVDLSARVRRVEIPRPRPTATDPAQPTTLTATLDNVPDPVTGISPLTPDSPLADHYPNLERDRRVRFTATWDASTSVRFLSWADKWESGMEEGPEDATVTLTASCILSRYARRRLLSDYAEKVLELAASAGPNDYWPYDEGTKGHPDAATLRGYGSDGPGVEVDVPAAEVVQPFKPDGLTGSLELGSADGGILVDGIATFSRGDSSAPSPVILHRLRDGEQVGRVSAWIKLDQDPALANDDAMAGYNIDGDLLWRLIVVLSGGLVVWRVVDAAGTMHSEWSTGHARDESWTWVSVLFAESGGLPTSAIAVRDRVIPDRVVAGNSGTWPADPRTTRWLVVGGRMPPKTKGKQVNTLMGSVSSVWVQYAELAGSVSEYSAAGVQFTGLQRTSAMLEDYGETLDTIVGGGVGEADADDTPVMLTGQAGSTLLEAWAEHARTVGGHVFTRPDGRREWRPPSETRPLTVALTLDAENDLHLPAGAWQGERDEAPTRVTASSPAGSITYIDVAAEAATGLRTEGSTLDTAAGTIDVALQAAAWETVQRGTRLASIGIDLTLTATDQIAATMALLPGERIRVTGLPSGTLGYTYRDVYASGWTEVYEPDAVTFTWDTDPADDPSEARFDDAEFGRFAMGDGAATITGGTCVGTTGTGTVVITTTSPLTTDAGEYPMDLDWLGERITISGVGGGSSPQTATVTARGVAPTVARVHVTGQAVDVWHAARFAR